MDETTFYEPMPRAWHCSVSMRYRCYVICGCPPQSPSPKYNAAEIQSKVEVFDVQAEQWKAEQVTGILPRGYGGASCIVPSCNCIYRYGGEDEHGESYGDLLQLNLENLTWSHFSTATLPSISSFSNMPLKKSGSGMVLFEADKKPFLGLFGGFGVLPKKQNHQLGSAFVKYSRKYNEGWSNEFHVLDLTKGTWSSPAIPKEVRPPPCCYFTFTSINNHQAVLFAGFDGSQRSKMSDLYLFDFQKMEIKNLSTSRQVRQPWPEERSSHAACCIGFGSSCPQLFVIGGRGRFNQPLKDAWLCDLTTVQWKQIILPENTLLRVGHSATAVVLAPGLIEVVVFGGCPECDYSTRNDVDEPMIAETVMYTFESHRVSSNSTNVIEWKLVGVVDNREREEKLRRISIRSHTINTIEATEDQHFAAVQKAIREKGKINHTIIHGVFVGPARSGKNSLMERLLGGMPSSKSPSTGVAESVVQVKVMPGLDCKTVATTVERSIWSVMDYDDEAIKLMLISSDLYVQDNQVPDSPEHRPVDQPKQIISHETSPVDSSQGLTVNDEASGNPVESRQHPMQPSVDSTMSLPLPSSDLHESLNPLGILKDALKSKGLEALRQHFEKSWSLFLTNTGGQIEFQEILPLLVSGPSIFFIVFRLDRDLDELYMIEYELSSDKKTKPYTSTLTTIDGIMHTLASISAMGTFVYKGVQCAKAQSPKVFFVGTHKDQLDSRRAASIISSIDEHLQQRIKSTSHYRDLIEFASRSQLIFTVNNFSDDDRDFLEIRLAVERIAERNEFQMISPVQWLIFSLAIRKVKSDVISYSECLQIAKKCGLAEDSVDEALHFIHTKMGLIRYFPHEGLKNIVIIRPQFLYDMVTNFIVDTFTFEKAGKQKMDEFKHKGIFSYEDFDVLATNTNMKPLQFIQLLEKLRIAAKFEIEGKLMYFVPCVLAHTSKIQYQSHATLLPPLAVTFQCGFCPQGVAGALIKFLMANEMNSQYSWILCHDKIYRNQVSFYVGLDTVVLKMSPTFLEIVCLSNDEVEGREALCPSSSLCYEIREAIQAGIIQVMSDLNYVNVQPQLTFPCMCNGGHPGQLIYAGDKPVSMLCYLMKKHFSLPNQYKLWQLSKSNYPDIKRQRLTTASNVEGVAIQAGIRFDSLLAAASSGCMIWKLAKFCVNWQTIGRYLNLTEADIAAVDGDYKTVEEKRIGMLLKWKEKFAFDATYKTLIEAFLATERKQTAIDACEVIGANSNHGDH